ncbi:MAG: acyl-CoA dehydrogenase C-terminal domain-containing protein [Proteobacteria bacterium]|nr:acyl-CoA dehydrogenase C-terminal domain-containing protein [Pseudomonadota bacterium]
MPNYEPPLKDYRFILHEALKVHEETAIEGYEELTPDFTGAVLEAAGKIASEVLAPLNLSGDVEGCRLENGVVRTPEGFREAFALMREGGWPSMECDPDYGGQDMPAVLSLGVGTMQSAANMAFMMYAGLTHGAYSAIHAHGTAEQKATYLPKMVSGHWTGTMNLTEPQCGTDLGLLRTHAEPQGDGSYRITGSKIFISSGEHDMAENIIHLVLARITGAVEGSRGISLFVVPKFLVNEDGSLGKRNGVVCSKIEEKMGIHANATCSMDYDNAAGWLIGEENKGLRAMFTMMNEARLLVGMQGLAVASAAYQNAAVYARDRLQGRAVTGAVNPDGPADPLIVHADVRRLLLDQKSFVDGGRTFLCWVAMLLDASKRHADPGVREQAGDMVALLTPVVKGFLTEEGYRLAGQAQQVFGGAGYIEETGMSQFVRDARITMIYEGATGVQALDLVGRKLPQKMGRPIMTFFEYVKGYIKDNEDDLTLAKHFLEPLKRASKDLQAAAVFFMQAGMKNPNAALAGSVDFLHLFGHVCMGLAWTKMAKAASVALQEGTGDPDYYTAKLTTGRYYMSRVLPETALRLTRIETGAEPVMDLPAEAF